jgi:hypothetical protein
MLKDQSNNNDTPGVNESSNDEEQYQRIFKKIARDFVCRADLDDLVNTLMKRIISSQEENKALENSEVNSSKLGAVMKAVEYKENLSLPKHKRRKYKDVIENDD